MSKNFFGKSNIAAFIRWCVVFWNEVRENPKVNKKIECLCWQHQTCANNTKMSRFLYCAQEIKFGTSTMYAAFYIPGSTKIP